MRGRAWRRDIKELYTIRRIKKNLRHHWRGFKCANHVRISHPGIADYIGTPTEFTAKTMSTSRYNRVKIKYSPNRTNDWYRSGETREGEKIIFRKILKENGII